MNHPPLRRFLGLDDRASDLAVLGLDTDVAPDPEVILRALAARIERLERHPAAESADAAVVRQHLNEAAERLIAPPEHVAGGPSRTTPRNPFRPVEETPPPPPMPTETFDSGSMDFAADDEADAAPPVTAATGPTRPGTGTVATLTDFDRTVLAILVGSGGWNAQSRGRLIELAGRRGVKPAALKRIVSGLAQLLHGGGFEAVAGAERAIDVALPPVTVPRAPTRMEVRMNQISEILSSEVRGETSGSRLRLGILFSLISIVLVGLFVAMLMLPSPAIEAARRKAAEVAARESLLATEDATDGMADVPRASAGFTEPDATDPAAQVVIPASWDDVPGFQGTARPNRALLRSHDAPGWITDLATLSRKASLPQASSSGRLLIDYRSFMEDAASCWPLLDPVIRSKLVSALLEPTAVGVSPGVREALFERIEDGFVTLNEPEDVWKASWAAGLLGTLVSDPIQPESMRARATERLLSELGSRRRTRGMSENPFEVTAGRRLDRMPSTLLQLAVDEDPEATDAWEYWIQAQKAVRSGVLLDVAWLDAIQVILDEGHALERPGLPLDVLGRLVSELDFSSRAHDPELLKMNLRSWFESAEVPSDNLWVLTSLLARSVEVPWWDGRLVLSPAATSVERRLMVQRFEAEWPKLLPTERPRGIPVSANALARMQSLRERLLLDVPRGDQIGMLHRLVTSARLTAAMEAFESGEPEIGFEELARAETGIEEAYEPLLHPEHVTGEIGSSEQRDGIWAEQWKRAGRENREARGALLRQLKQRRGGDLGPVDAAALANEAYRGQPRDIRLLAQSVIVEDFAMGPNVAMALLDLFEYSPKNPELVDFFFNLGVNDMPVMTEKNWHAGARLALARHAFGIQASELHDLDLLAATYASILGARFERLGGDAYLLESRPEEVASALTSLIERRARERFVSNPIPASLQELERRRAVRWTSARTAAQQLAAELTALVDLATYESGSLRPDLRQILAEDHLELTSRVATASDVLEQLLSLEVALGDLILVRLEAEERDG
jgi:hypothetical protein